jgi:hypothetical protein
MTSGIEKRRGLINMTSALNDGHTSSWLSHSGSPFMIGPLIPRMGSFANGRPGWRLGHYLAGSADIAGLPCFRSAFPNEVLTNADRICFSVKIIVRHALEFARCSFPSTVCLSTRRLILNKGRNEWKFHTCGSAIAALSEHLAALGHPQQQSGTTGQGESEEHQ